MPPSEPPQSHPSNEPSGDPPSHPPGEASSEPVESPLPQKSLVEIAGEQGLYPPEAFQFVAEGLEFTVTRIHGAESAVSASDPVTRLSRHISGQDLCQGLRAFALAQWGLLARTVLRRWNITCTMDFGRIVFAMIEAGQMQKTERDNVDDFRDVFDFATAFESDYRIEHPT